MSAQVIKYKCCGKIFAACTVPECYTSKEWLKDVRTYALKGHTVEIAERVKFEKCTCVEVGKSGNLFV